MKGIVYACIAERDSHDGSTFSIIGDFPATPQKDMLDTVKTVLPRISSEPHKRTLTQTLHHYHYKVSGSFCYFCVTDPDFPIRITYNFLDDLEVKYLRTKTDKIRALIRDNIAYFNNTKNDKISKLQTKVDDVKETMIDNLDKLIERGEHLDSLVYRTDELKDGSLEFRKTAVKLKRAMYKRWIVISILLVAIILGAIGLTLGIVFTVLCNNGTLDCKPKSTTPSTTTPAPAPTPTPRSRII
ncbi:vesicle-associated membrane protein 7 [Acrasis kona]|uniref:Vesicle-associated membrane protein 7 n=1 Tax=Acrasis kona TaxID=1008807 RepID=A0AAW2YWZ5_9EUKA